MSEDATDAHELPADARDEESQRRYIYGLALAYRLFNVVELVESLAKGEKQGAYWRKRARESQARRVLRAEATPSAERAYIARVASLKRLSAGEELALARRMRAGDELARNLLVSANLGLVVMFARQYARSGAAFIDLVAEGNIGLLQATRTFDPERGFRFSTYAKRPVTQAMSRALPRLIGAVNVPIARGSGTETAARDEASKDESSNQSESDPKATPNPLGETPWHSLPPLPDIAELPAEDQDEPTFQIENAWRDRTLNLALNCLSTRERDIVSARFGLGGSEQQTLATLANQYGISIERVRQIEKAGLKRLAEQLSQAGHGLDTML